MCHVRDVQDRLNAIPETIRRKVTLYVSDTENKMKGLWRMIEAEYPKIFAYGCATHTLNLLLGDIGSLDHFSGMLKQMQELISFFRGHSVPHTRLKRRSKTILDSQEKEIGVIKVWGRDV